MNASSLLPSRASCITWNGGCGRSTVSYAYRTAGGPSATDRPWPCSTQHSSWRVQTHEEDHNYQCSHPRTSGACNHQAALDKPFAMKEKILRYLPYLLLIGAVIWCAVLQVQLHQASAKIQTLTSYQNKLTKVTYRFVDNQIQINQLNHLSSQAQISFDLLVAGRLGLTPPKIPVPSGPSTF